MTALANKTSSQAPAAAGVRPKRSKQRTGQHPAIASARSIPSRHRIFRRAGRAIFPASWSISTCARPRACNSFATSCAAEAYRDLPRLFVLADALHHGSMQAWALGATDTIARPFDARGHSAAHPRRVSRQRTDTTIPPSGKALNRGVEAAHAVMVKIFQQAAGRHSADLQRHRASRETILKAIKHSSLARMADDGRLPSHRYLSPLPVCHRFCGRLRPASRHARG